MLTVSTRFLLDFDYFYEVSIGFWLFLRGFYWILTVSTRFLLRRVPHIEQELLTLSKHLSSSPVFSGVCVARSLVFCVVIGFWLFLRGFYWILTVSTRFSFFRQWVFCSHMLTENNNCILKNKIIWIWYCPQIYSEHFDEQYHRSIN
jgi:hypothetical protein